MMLLSWCMSTLKGCRENIAREERQGLNDLLLPTGVFIKRRATWNFIKNKLRLTIGTLAFISLFADSIQIIEFLNHHFDMMKDLIKWIGIGFCIALAHFPTSSTDLAAYAG